MNKVLEVNGVFATAIFPTVIFPTDLFSTAIFPTTIFVTAIFQTVVFQTAIFHLYIYTWSYTWFPHQVILPSIAQMSSLYRLDSSSSSSDDDDELTLAALHIAHTQYQAMNAPQWGGSVVGRDYIYRDREGGARR